MNRAIMEARSHITWYMMGVGLWMPGWWFFFRPDPHVDDLVNVDAALKALRSRDPKSAAGHLQKVWMMGWGHWVGTEAFNLLWQRFYADPSWRGAWDRQQECVNVHADYVALARGVFSTDIEAHLASVRADLRTWIQEDLRAIAHHVEIGTRLLPAA